MLRINSSIIKKIDELDYSEEMKDFLKWVLAHVRDNYEEGQPTNASKREVEQKLISLLGEKLKINDVD